MASRFGRFFKLFGTPEPVAAPVPAQAPPDAVAALLSAAANHVTQGEPDQAIARYSRVIDLQPDLALAWYKRGNLLKDGGRLEAALTDYDRAIALDPQYAYALCNRGFVLARLGRPREALDSYDRAVAVNPDDVIAHFGRADVLRGLQRPEEAIASYGRAIAIHPGHVESYCNRGVLYTELGQFNEALADFDRALTINKDVADVYLGRARLMHKQGRAQDALADYSHAVRLNPNLTQAHLGVVEALTSLERYQEGLAGLDEALVLWPDYPELYRAKANILLKQNRHVECIEACERALACKPDLDYVLGLRQHCKMWLCDWQAFDAEVGEVLENARKGASVTIPFALTGITDDPSVLHTVARTWVQCHCPSRGDLPELSPHPAGEKLRIGYFSCDLRDHPVAILMAELFEIHDRGRFEMTAFSLGLNSPSELRPRLERAFDRFIDAGAMSDTAVALLARHHRIDIAIDLAGHTSGGRLGIFSRRAAPIQATWLGYAGTTGAPYMDYLIGDRTVIPPEQRQHFSEKLVYLPHCYLLNDSTRPIAAVPTREQAGLPYEGFVFCSFNTSYKFTPEVFSSWMRILARVAGSVLWLPQGNPVSMENLRREAQLRGVDPRRLIFAVRTPPGAAAEHLARLRLAGLFLDTLPYNAHSTTIDALWAGLPVLTRLGGSFAGRVAASLLRAIQMPELITTNIQQYEDMAVELATNPTRLAEIRERLARNRLTTPLFDTRAFARELEDAYLRMHERYRAGLAPDHIDVPAAVS